MSSAPEPSLLCILGATATGKTRVAVALARAVGGEVLSADSRQVFRGMDVGTGKDLDEFARGGAPVRHHLIDVAEPGDEFHVFDYQRLFLAAYRDAASRGAVPILCGGTGLYLDAVLSAYRLVEAPENPELRAELETMTDDALVARLAAHGPLHNTTDTRERARLVRAIEIAEASRASDAPPFPELPSRVFGMRLPRADLRRRIAERLDARLAAGLIGEVERLLAGGVPERALDRYGLEYRWVTRFVRGGIDRPALRDGLLADIRRFAKQQETWFRRMERRGTRITWLDAREETARLVERILRTDPA